MVLLASLMAAAAALPAPTLTTQRPLELVHYAEDLDEATGEPKVGLVGTLQVAVHNPGTEPLVVVAPNVHGLAFTDTTTGAVHHVRHPCQCGLAQAGEHETLTIAPGQTETRSLGLWHCHSVWVPPPPGTHTLSFHLQAHPAAAPTPATSGVSAERCLAQIRQQQASGTPSNPLPVTLSKPSRKAVASDFPR